MFVRSYYENLYITLLTEQLYEMTGNRSDTQEQAGTRTHGGCSEDNASVHGTPLDHLNLWKNSVELFIIFV